MVTEGKAIAINGEEIDIRGGHHLPAWRYPAGGGPCPNPEGEIGGSRRRRSTYGYLFVDKGLGAGYDL